MSGVDIHSARTRPVMPGGGVARRPLHVILLGDCSGSMQGPKIQALNFAIGADVEQIADQLHRASLWVTNPNVRSARLPGGPALPAGPIIGDISDVVL
ncbi:MAG TPA: hypothetical protein VFQ44_07710 [Streptosporangiaceae bacterium]|nr:hypothetical protein [Streptosporangiaceae bacterium]